jgi:cytochrome oxidase Cu insertion factor (SCO1/SenC/PrrC family)
VQPVFISIDPERDTTEQLALYVTSIHPRLVGFTGSLQEVRKVALAYKAYFAKVAGRRPNDYDIDHTSFIYFGDREGKHIGFLPPSTDVERVTETIRALLSKH